MEKEFKITSLKEYNDLLANKKYLGIIQKEIVENTLNYQGFVIIKEEEDSNTLVSRIRIMPCEDADNILYKTEIIKDNLNKYAKEGIEDSENCTINRLRETLIKVKNHFGNDWSKDFVYSADKYKVIKDLIRNCIKVKMPVTMIGMIKDNFSLLADKISKDSIYFGKGFATKLGILINQERLRNVELSNFLNYVLNSAGEKYKKVYLDCKLLNKKLNYENVTIATDSIYELKGLDCRIVSVQNGNVNILKSVVDKFIFGKGLKMVIINDVMTEKRPKVDAGQKKKVIIKKVITYNEIKVIEKKKARDAILRSTYDEDGVRVMMLKVDGTSATTPSDFDSVKKYS